jgi:DNA-binding CsgD family transcriptional regulator
LELAAESLRATHDRAREIGFRGLGALPYHANLVEALAAIDAIDEAAEVVTAIADTAMRSGRPRGAAELARAEALLFAGRGDLAAAADAADRSLVAHRRLALPIERGRVLLIAGVIARRAKRRGPARHLLEDAEHVFAAHGATALQRRATAELGRLGGNRGGQLSPTEERIADLVVAGRTNDEIAAELFVSRRTVESNLTHVYRKLGVRSRTELAARLR